MAFGSLVATKRLDVPACRRPLRNIQTPAITAATRTTVTRNYRLGCVLFPTWPHTLDRPYYTQGYVPGCYTNWKRNVSVVNSRLKQRKQAHRQTFFAGQIFSQLSGLNLTGRTNCCHKSLICINFGLPCRASRERRPRARQACHFPDANDWIL